MYNLAHAPGGFLRLLIIGAAILASIWLVGCLVLYIHLPVSPDQALFDYISWSLLTGGGLYTDVFEINWPGEIFIHMLGTYLFGPGTWSFRMIDALVLLLVTAGMAVFLRRIGFSLAPILVLLLYPALYISSGSWMAGQRDIVAAGFLIAAAGIAIPPVSRGRARTMELFLSGATIAFAVLIRPTVLPFFVGLLAIEHFRLPQAPADRGTARRSLLIAAGFLGSLGAVALYAAWQGSLAGWYLQTVRFNVEVYVTETPTVSLLEQLDFLVRGSWHWLAIFSALSLGIWIIRHQLTYGAVVILGLLATVLVSYFAQDKGFGYHLGGLLTVFALLNAILVEHLVRIWRAAPWHLGRTVALLFVIAVVAGGTLKKTTTLWTETEHLAMVGESDLAIQQSVTEIAAIVAEGSTPDETFLQWGRIYHAPYLAERPSPWPFINDPLRYGAHLFSKWPQWKQLAETGLRSHPPAFVLVSRASLTAPMERRPPLMKMMLEYIRDYEIVRETPTLILYRRLGF